MTLAILGVCLLVLSQQNSPAEASELLARGVQLMPSKPAEAVRVLQQALRLDPRASHIAISIGPRVSRDRR